MTGDANTTAPEDIHQLWLAHRKIQEAGENLALRISEGEINPIVAYGDVGCLSTLPLTSIESLGEVYALTYRDGSGKSCKVIASPEDIANSMVTPLPSCTRVPNCPWDHGNEEISAG